MNFYTFKHASTKKWKIFILILIFFIIELLIWLLLLQGNVLILNLFATKGMTLWNGKVVDQNTINWILEKFHVSVEPDNIGKYIKITSDTIVIKFYAILSICLSFIFMILLTIVLKLTKVINLDALTLLLPFILSCSIFNFVDLIPHWNNEIVRGIVIIAIMLVIITTLFFIFNAIFNNYLLKHSVFDLTNEYKNEMSEEHSEETKIKDLLNDKDDPTTIVI